MRKQACENKHKITFKKIKIQNDLVETTAV